MHSMRIDIQLQDAILLIISAHHSVVAYTYVTRALSSLVGRK